METALVKRTLNLVRIGTAFVIAGQLIAAKLQSNDGIVPFAQQFLERGAENVTQL
jgi:hypothetical protein